MKRADSQSVSIRDPSIAEGGAAYTGNVLPVLHEVRHALRRLLENDEDTIIDLRALPMAPGEEARLEALLGEGEVRAEFRALGPSVIRETAISGVWLTTHFNAQDEIVGKYIEITRMPAILRSQVEDMRHGLEALVQRIDELSPE